MTGLPQLIVGGADIWLLIAILVIAGLTPAFSVVSAWPSRRDRQYNSDRLYPPVEV